MSETTIHDDEAGMPEKMKVILFAGIMVLLCLFFFGGIGVVLAVKYAESDSKPKKDVYGYNSSYSYSQPVFAEKMVITTDEPLTRVTDPGIEKDLQVELPTTRIPNLDPTLIESARNPEPKLDVTGLDKSLKITSTTPVAIPGKDYSYFLTSESKSGGVSYTLISGPKGLTISPAGIVAWKVPGDYLGESEILLSVKDASGREIYYAFQIPIR